MHATHLLLQIASTVLLAFSGMIPRMVRVGEPWVRKSWEKESSGESEEIEPEALD